MLTTKFLIWSVVAFSLVRSLIVEPPDYDMTMLFVPPAVPEFSDLKYLVQRGFVRSDEYSCLTDTHKPKHSVNKCFPITNRTQATQDPSFLHGTTYWYNEFMHIGHVPFDSVLIQLLKTTKIDRIVIQVGATNLKLI